MSNTKDVDEENAIKPASKHQTIKESHPAQVQV
jgi:hypothetical protein